MRASSFSFSSSRNILDWNSNTENIYGIISTHVLKRTYCLSSKRPFVVSTARFPGDLIRMVCHTVSYAGMEKMRNSTCWRTNHGWLHDKRGKGTLSRHSWLRQIVTTACKTSRTGVTESLLGVSRLDECLTSSKINFRASWQAEWPEDTVFPKFIYDQV